MAKHAEQGLALADVVVGSPGAMSIHIADVCRGQASHTKSLAHGQISSFAIVARSCLMESVASITIATESPKDAGFPFLGRLFRFNNDIGCAFAQIQPGPVGIEWLTLLMVKYHQGIETVQMELCNTLCSTYHRDVRLSATYQVCPKNNGIGCRRTCRRDAGDHGENAKIIGN